MKPVKEPQLVMENRPRTATKGTTVTSEAGIPEKLLETNSGTAAGILMTIFFRMQKA